VVDSGVVADSPQAIGTRVLRATTHLMDGLDRIHMTVSPSVPARSRRHLAVGSGFKGLTFAARHLRQIDPPYRGALFRLAHPEQHCLPHVSPR
jgi:hypothetical protein